MFLVLHIFWIEVDNNKGLHHGAYLWGDMTEYLKRDKEFILSSDVRMSVSSGLEATVFRRF